VLRSGVTRGLPEHLGKGSHRRNKASVIRLIADGEHLSLVQLLGAPPALATDYSTSAGNRARRLWMSDTRFPKLCYALKPGNFGRIANPVRVSIIGHFSALDTLVVAGKPHDFNDLRTMSAFSPVRYWLLLRSKVARADADGGVVAWASRLGAIMMVLAFRLTLPIDVSYEAESGYQETSSAAFAAAREPRFARTRPDLLTPGWWTWWTWWIGSALFHSYCH
jgi:hypothetical protein